MKVTRQCYSLIFISALLFFSCAPKQFKPWKPASIKFKKTPPYSIEKKLDKIKKPSKLIPQYAIMSENNLKIIPAEQKSKATHIVFVPTEYAKVAALLLLSTTYKEMALEEAALINIYIDQINALKEMLIIEQQNTLLYRQLWVDSENARRQQEYDSRWEELKREGIILLEALGIIALIFAF